MKKIALIVAMQEEADPLLAKLEVVKEEEILGCSVFLCRYKNIEISILICGIGKVNASIGVAVLHREFNPELIINIGSAAGLHESLKPGDIVMADQLSYYDVDVTTFNYQMGQVPRMPAFYTVDENALTILRELCKEEMHVKCGLVLSGDSFLQCKNKVADIKKHFPQVYAIDMEATAVAQACYRLKTACLVLRSITDSGDDAAKEAHENFLEYAQKNVSEVLTFLLDKYC